MIQEYFIINNKYYIRNIDDVFLQNVNLDVFNYNMKKDWLLNLNKLANEYILILLYHYIYSISKKL